jgi:DNA polymerase-3 subunit epsilon
MRTYLDVSLPSRTADVRTLPIVALDLETTGLDPSSDAIVSAGFLRIDGTSIRCESAEHILVQIDGSVEHSATIHQITDTDLREAVTEREMLDRLLEVLAGRVMLVHHAPMDLGFLNAACRRHYNQPLIVRTVDTLPLARQLSERGDQRVSDGELRLHALRTAYGLPRYPAHNALSDALATAELYLALLPLWAGTDALPLRAILS